METSTPDVFAGYKDFISVYNRLKVQERVGIAYLLENGKVVLLQRIEGVLKDSRGKVYPVEKLKAVYLPTLVDYWVHCNTEDIDKRFIEVLYQANTPKKWDIVKPNDNRYYLFLITTDNDVTSPQGIYFKIFIDALGEVYVGYDIPRIKERYLVSPILQGIFSISKVR